MKFLEFISAVNLFEAAKDRYAQMFENLAPMYKELGKSEEFESYVKSEIEWAMRTLKKQDKIIWYLRMVKVDMLHSTATNTMAPQVNIVADPPEYAERLKFVHAKAVSQLAKKMGIENQYAEASAAQTVSTRFKRNMEHFMSLELPTIEQYVFSNQMPQQILNDWTLIEDAWKEKREQTVPIDREGIDTVIKYPDGSEWVNLNKAYCELEGDAMGHCGNSATPKEGDTVLSYRTIEEVDGEQLWKPRLTFILDKHGLLGETKGRANQKPAEKYHDVIVDLLRLPIVKGIKGGGYEAQNNFKLADLPQEVQEELIEEKPGLADIEYDYGKRGMTKDLMARMEGLWEDTQIAFPEYHKSPNASEGEFRHDTRYTLAEFVNAYGGHTGEWVLKVLEGDEYLDTYYSGMPVNDLWTELPPKIQHAVGEWLIENYADAVEEWKEENDSDYDGTDEGDTWDIMSENGISEVTDALEDGMSTGYQYGAEKEMADSFNSWLNDLPNERELSLSVSPGNDGSSSRQELVIPEATMVDIVSNWLEEVTYAGDLDKFPEIKELESPYNGYDGYDEEAAKERAIERLHEEGIIEQ